MSDKRRRFRPTVEPLASTEVSDTTRGAPRRSESTPIQSDGAGLNAGDFPDGD
jgi:hypothetical protein